MRRSQLSAAHWQGTFDKFSVVPSLLVMLDMLAEYLEARRPTGDSPLTVRGSRSVLLSCRQWARMFSTGWCGAPQWGVAYGLNLTDTPQIELLKLFNSRTCQLVLGAGAMHLAGLKSINAKHLALSTQCLGFAMSQVGRAAATRLLSCVFTSAAFADTRAEAGAYATATRQAACAAQRSGPRAGGALRAAHTSAAP
jgi:hypothetical protein